MELTPFDKSIIKIATLNPNIYSSLDFNKTKEEVLLFIYPFLGEYYVVNKDENNNPYLDTIFNELSSFNLEEEHYKRFFTEKLIRVCKYPFSEDTFDFYNYTGYNSKKIKSILSRNPIQLGNIVFQGWKNDYTLQKEEYIVENFIFLKNNLRTIISIRSIIKFIDNVSNFPKEYKDIIINILNDVNKISIKDGNASFNYYKLRANLAISFYPTLSQYLNFILKKLNE